MPACPPQPHLPPPSPPPPQTAIERAVVYHPCTSLTGPERAACQFDKALANVGALFAKQVDGRVSTEVDPRLAHDEGEGVVVVGLGVGWRRHGPSARARVPPPTPHAAAATAATAPTNPSPASLQTPW